VKKLNKGLKKVQKSFEASMLNRPEIELELKRRKEKLKQIEESNGDQIRYDFRKRSEHKTDDDQKMDENVQHKIKTIASDGDMYQSYKKTNDSILDKLSNLKRN